MDFPGGGAYRAEVLKTLLAEEENKPAVKATMIAFV